MKVERLKQIEEIYHAALNVEPARLEPFFAEHCGADEELRREVESLLSFENVPDSFLDIFPESLAAEMLAEKDLQNNLIGAEIGHYKIIKLLGKGGMGKVYLAEDIRLDRRIAVKFLNDEFVHDADKLNRFRREAKSASALNHPNILTVYEIGESSGSHYIATEFIDGKVLNHHSSEAKLSLDSVLDISIQIVSALRTAHEAGIVHRDIKPDNLMVRKDGIVKVLDFGLAKLTEKQNSNETNLEAATLAKFTTNPGIIMGTPNYMSPEQARGMGITYQTDIFSFGIVLYEMLAGKLPFDGASAMDVMGAILYKEPPPLKQLLPELPRDVELIVDKALCKNTSERYQNAKDILSDLHKVKQRLDYEEVGRSFPPESSQADSETKNSDSSSFGQTAASSTPNNLSSERPNLVGRETETAEIMDLLGQSETGLLTLTGVGGTGKTRLAEAISRLSLAEFADGVYFIRLAAIDNHELVLPIISQTLGVREEAGKSLLECLHNNLREKNILLVLDNFEQITKAAPTLAELFTVSPNLKILITSRVRLNLKLEREFTLQPLEVPADEKLSANEFAKFPAIELFVKRAKTAKFDFALTEENAFAVAEICRRLDGLPLAIELAAVRVKLFAPAAILKRLEKALDLLTGGAKDLPERQQTMRGAIAWSYDLLDADEKKLLNRLSVFRGGLTLEGAETVGNADTDLTIGLLDAVSSLVDKSLLSQREQNGGEPRFKMLVVVREFAFEKLAESGAADQIKRRHAEFYTALAEKGEPDLLGAKSAEWMKTFEKEHDNLRSALEWSLDNKPENALRIAGIIYRFWLRCGYSAEGRKWTRAALEKNGKDSDPILRAKAARGGGLMSLQQGDFKAANSFIEESLRLSREVGDKSLICYALTSLGAIKVGEGNLTEAQTLTEECLVIAEEIDDKFQIAVSLNRLGDMSRQKEDYPAARQIYEKAYAIAKQESINAAIPIFAHNLASITCLLEDYQSSRLYNLEALKGCEELGHKTSIGRALNIFAGLAVKSDEIEKSAQLFGAAQKIYEENSYQLEKVDQDFNEYYASEARAIIGDEAFDKAYAQGRAMRMEDAIALARKSDSKRQSDFAKEAYLTDQTLTNRTNLRQAVNTLDPQPAPVVAPISQVQNVSIANYFAGQLRRRKRPMIIASAILGLLLVIYGIFGFYGYLNYDSPFKSVSTSTEPMKQMRLTTLGRVTAATISPDGNFLAYVAKEGLKSTLYMKGINTGNITAVLPPTEIVYRDLIFSPDGNRIYFLQNDAKTTALNNLAFVDSGGGAPQKLISDVDSMGSFSPDGQEIVFRRDNPALNESAIFIARADGTNERKIAACQKPDSGFIQTPLWLADGRTVAAMIKNNDGNEFDAFSLVTINIADGTQKPLGDQRWNWFTQMTLIPGRNEILLNAQRKTGEPHQLWRVAYPSGEVVKITNDFNNYLGANVTADGSSLITVKNTQSVNLFVAPFNDLNNPHQLTSVDGVTFKGLGWTPDGKIVYSSNINGKRDIWIMNADGSGVRKIINDQFSNFNPVITSDGKQIVYESDRSGKPNIWRVNIDGSDPFQITNGAGEANPTVSPDNKWIFYDATSLLYKVSFDGGAPTQIAGGSIYSPVISPDGKSIAARYWNGGNAPVSLSIFPAAGETPIRNYNIPAEFWRWTNDSSYLIYVDSSAGYSNFFRLPLEKGETKPLTNFKNEQIFGFDISRDGRQVVFLRGATNSDAVMIKNFR